ncbi:hypothetical protein [Clostridium fessum]|uniref:hypothetical protein n=1 Tax=Clostridium fessum TaxID=2126740 RepID=UPI0022E1C205|nr:hypothetical protein [Clostridium fessum]
MKSETNTGFDASITVAQDREAVVKTAEKLPPKFHFPPVKEPQAVQMGCHSPFRGCSWSGWYRVHIQGYQNDKAGFSKLESLYANNPQEMYRVFIRAMTKPASSDANIFKDFPDLSDVP